MKAACLLLWSVAASLMVHSVQSQVLGDVFLYEAGKGEKEPVHFDPFPDLPADFGPEVPDEGIDGLLFVADPEDACEPLTNRYDDEPWVALISRSQHAHPTNCTFDVKVHNAELAGAAAAIVYDDVYEALIIMSKPRDHDDPGIPAVFVSEKAGIIMRKLMTPGVTRVRIVPVSASAWMSLLMSAFLGFLALTVVLATFYVMRSWSMWLGRTRRRGMAPELAGFGALGAQAGAQEGLPACAIRALPILIYEGKPSKHRRSSTGSIQPPPAAAETLDAAGQRAPSAPVPIAAPAAAAENAAWLAGSPAMPETPQALAAGEDVRSGQHAGQRRSSAADTAVVLIESDSEGDTSGARRQREQQQASGLGQRLATSSSAVTSGLISLASLAAAGSRRVLLLGGHGSPSSSAPGDSAAMAAAAAAAAGHPCGHSSSARDAAAAVDVPGAAAATAADGGTGSGCATPTGSMSCRSSLYSTDDEDGDLPEVVQSWPGAGGMARVVTGGPVGARGGATRHTCVVCLERYSAGDKIRVLPCQHRFHAKCIDPWLASRRLCPVCKHDASTWPSNSLQAALSGPVPLDTPAPPAAAAGGGGGGQVNPSLGGVNLLSAPLSAGVVSLAGRGYWFRRLRARLARASRRRQQQQQQEQQQLLAAGGVGLGMGPAHAAAAVAEAAEAGLLQPPPAAVTVDVRQGLQPVLSTQPGSLQQQEPQLQAVQQGEQGRQQQQQQQQQQRSQQQRRRGQQQRQGSGLQEPLLPAQ